MKKIYGMFCIFILLGCNSTSATLSSWDMEKEIHEAIIEEANAYYKENTLQDIVHIEELTTLKIEKKKDSIFAYVRVLCETYKSDLTVDKGYQTPLRIEFKEENSTLKVKELCRPNDGSLYEPSIRKLFPKELVNDAMKLEFFDENKVKTRKEKARVAFENLHELP